MFCRVEFYYSAFPHRRYGAIILRSIGSMSVYYLSIFDGLEMSNYVKKKKKKFPMNEVD